MLENAAVSRLHEQQSHDPADFAVPTGREEEWRFTPLRRLRGLHADAPLGTAGVRVEVDPAPQVASDLTERGQPALDASFIPADRVSARASAAARCATTVRIPKETVASRPTYITITAGTTPAGVDGPSTPLEGVNGPSTPRASADRPRASADGQRAGGASADAAATAAAGHIVIEAEPYSKAVVVLDYRGSGTYADNVEILAGDGSDLSVISIAGWADDSVHVSHHYARVGRDAHLTHVAVTLGGSVVRISPTVRYAGPGGDAELYGMYFADAGQHLEHRLFVDHDTPNCRSRVRYKGALQGETAHTVWIGDVLITPEATGTDTYEYNRNLVLSDGARADSVPNLEILTGEVLGAGHASASGRLEDEHLFYLMARGIPEREARRLVIRGFFGELIGKIGVPELRERITQAFEAELS